MSGSNSQVTHVTLNTSCSDGYLDEVTEEDFEFYYDCVDDTSDSDCESASDNQSMQDTDVVTKLAKWIAGNSVSLNAVSQLLPIFRPRYPELPKDPRTIMKTNGETNEDKMQLVSNGTYYHFGLASSIVQQVHSLERVVLVKETGTVSFQLNIDGVPLFKSTNGQFWPVLGKIDKPFVGKPFVIGLYYGVTKPSNLDFLNDFCNEYADIRQSGIPFDNTILRCYISVIVCDAPARALVKCVKGHTSYSSCERCTQTGVWAGKITLPAMLMLRTAQTSLSVRWMIKNII